MKHNAYESYNFSFTCFLKLKWEYKYAFYYITLIQTGLYLDKNMVIMKAKVCLCERGGDRGRERE